MVEQDPTRPLHHAFWFARRPRGEHDKDGMVKRQLFKLEGRLLFCSQEVFIMDGIGNISDIWLRSRIGNNNNFLEGRDGFGHLCCISQGVEGFRLIKITVYGEQDLGLYLTESVQSSLRPDVCGARRQDSSDAGR